MGKRYAGRYELIDPLGEGGMGSVWRAWDAKSERYVAAKLLRHSDSGALLRFVREQSLRVTHPHVAPPTGWAAEDDDVLLTMELVAGGSVATLLRDYGHLPPAWAVVLVDQLLQGLAAVHATGIVHRDVKPANLLLDATGTAAPVLRLADFGISAVVGEPRLTSTGSVVGTAGYLAPELLAGAEPDPRQDLFAVGVVAAELLTGSRTLPPGTWPAPHVLDVLRALCADDPERRPASATRARQLLDEAARADGIAAEVAAVREGRGAELADEPVEVFRHLPDLPAGWPAVDDTPPDVVGTPPALVGTPPAVVGLPPAVDDARTQPRTQSPPDPDTEPLTPVVATPRGRISRARAAAAAVLVAVALVLFVLAVRSGGAPGEEPSGPSSTEGGLVGSSCLVTETGQRRSTASGEVVCAAADGALRWERVG